jgi:hypothetical protein
MSLDAMKGAGDEILAKPDLVSQCLNAVEECLKATRTISYLLHPPLLDEEALSLWPAGRLTGLLTEAGFRRL